MAIAPSPEPQGPDDSPKQTTIFGVTLEPATLVATGTVADTVVPPSPTFESQSGADGAPVPVVSAQARRRAKTQVNSGVNVRFGSAAKPGPGTSAAVPDAKGERRPPKRTLNPADPFAFPTKTTSSSPPQGPGEDKDDLDGKAADEAQQSTNPPNRLSDSDDSSVMQEAKRRMAETVLASPRNDNPLSTDSVDLLGFGDDAKAFARLAASKDVKPPLAIAIFGSWGSGKSFFMRLIHEHVQRLSDGKPDSTAPEAASESFHRGIAQIRFNAWHYSETNLWASLVDHLFTQLGTYVKAGEAPVEPGSSVLDNLSTTRTLTIESAERLEAQRKTQAALADNLVQAEAERKNWEREVMARPRTYLDVIQKIIASNDAVAGGPETSEAKLKGDIQAAAHRLGIDNLVAEAEKVADELRTADSLAGETKIVFDSVAMRAGGKLEAALAFACIPAALMLLWAGARALQAANVSEVTALVLQTVASLALVGTALRKLISIAAPVLAKMRVVKKAVDDKLAEGMAEYDKSLEANREKLRKAEALVAAAKQDLAASAASLVSAVEDFHGSTGTGRLLRFLRTRAKDGHYAQHLGLVASVRRDFEELSLGMQGAGSRVEMPAEELVSLRARLSALTGKDSALLAEDRNILQGLTRRLDDIEMGAQSLKPPFSRLVLYVDDLDRCSHEKVIDVLQAVHMLTAFPLFMVFVAVDVRWLSQALVAQYGGMLAPLDGPRDRTRAAPHDYLEKIFQLPYWIEEVNETSGVKLLEALLPIDEDEELAGPPVPSAPAAERPTSGNLDVPLTVRSLKFKHLHRDLVALFLPYFVSSPRKLLWFVNAFRVLKATSVPLRENDEEQLDFAIIMQLALASISTKEFHAWLAALNGFEGPQSLGSMINDFPWPKHSSLFWSAADKAAHHAKLYGYELFDPGMLLRYGRRAHRFCFSAPEPINAPSSDSGVSVQPCRLDGRADQPLISSITSPLS